MSKAKLLNPLLFILIIKETFQQSPKITKCTNFDSVNPSPKNKTDCKIYNATADINRDAVCCYMKVNAYTNYTVSNSSDISVPEQIKDICIPVETFVTKVDNQFSNINLTFPGGMWILGDITCRSIIVSISLLVYTLIILIIF